MSKNKTIFLTGLVVVVIVVLIFYIYNFNNNKTNDIDNSKNNNENINLENKKNIQQENVIVDTRVVDKKITISNRCIGCGRCAIIDPEHFRMNEIIRKAEVVSQENLTSKSLLDAISMCRESAILLN